MKNNKKKQPSLGISFKNDDGIKYEIVWKKPAKSYGAYGLCDDPTSKNPQIWIDPDLDNKKLIEIIVHELTHAFFFKTREKCVTKFAKVVTKVFLSKFKV